MKGGGDKERCGVVAQVLDEICGQLDDNNIDGRQSCDGWLEGDEGHGRPISCDGRLAVRGPVSGQLAHHNFLKFVCEVISCNSLSWMVASCSRWDSFVTPCFLVMLMEFSSPLSATGLVWLVVVFSPSSLYSEIVTIVVLVPSQ